MICMLVGAAAVLALFFPTSWGAVIQNSLVVLATASVLLIHLVVGGLTRFSSAGLFLGVCMICILIIATIVSPLPIFTPGALAPYLSIAALFSLTIDRLDRDYTIAVRVFLFASVAILCFAYGIIYEVQFVMDLNDGYYRAFGEELFESMILWHKKPVSVFASHSIAAFLYFAFLLLHIELGFACRSLGGRAINALCIAGYLYVIGQLASATSVILMVASAIWILARIGPYLFKASIPLGVLVSTLIIAILMSGFVRTFASQVNYEEVMFNSESGLLGRYSFGGRLQPTYNFIMENPFRPIGLTYDPEIYLGDNFIAEYIVRGTVVLYIVVIVLMFKFLRRNLISRVHAGAIAAYFFASDVGYPLLTYSRMPAILLLSVFVLNHCSSKARASRPI